MTVGQMESKLAQAKNAQNSQDRALLCRLLLEDAIGFIYEKAGVEFPKKASLLELIDGLTVSSYINDSDTISTLHYVRILGMNAQHGKHIKKKEAKLAFNNIFYLIGLIKAKENGTEATYRKPPYMSEAETRRQYIDLYLQEAGWEVLTKENIAQPSKAGVEIEVQGMPNPHGVGYCDYVLYGRDGKPLAIIEVKKTSMDAAKGRHQVDLYGECMKKVYGYKPVVYYTNGYNTQIIDGIYPDRPVMAFHSQQDLELLLQRRNRGNITDLTINANITDRPYQKMAITSICEWLNSKHRRGLLVMATGTGKTRVTISLVDVLANNKWVKNVLFLADRTSLVNQAKRAFTRLLPKMSVCELSGDEPKDLNARLIFCTYQTMIHYIDAEEKVFSSGHFDLIIIDEAHRSIFNRYGTIFKYFDSFLIGLTATPKNEVDANTYKIFGCEAGIPNYDYSMEEAVNEKYLVGYRVINRTSSILTKGIDLNALTEEEKAQLDEYLEEDPPTPDFNIPGNEIFKYLFNEDTCKRVLEELMMWGNRVNGGETLGKTIIFAYNHRHAQMIVDCFHNMYPEYPANTCQLVDYSISYGQDLVLQFEQNDEFRIAVSVDMLDTGVDVPAVLNLVFFKKVRSKIKFVQMIGRGTRLCEDLYGTGKDKSGFLIFDYCGNFEYFGMNPDGKEGKEIQSLSQRMFEIRLDMLYELQRIEYQEDSWFHMYYDRIKAELHAAVVKVKSHSKRIQVRESMQYVDKYYNWDTWISLSPVMVKEVKKYISPLLDSGLNGNHLSIAFDIRMFHVEKALLESGNLNSVVKHVKNIRLVAQYLVTEKASVPQVLSKAKELKTLVTEDFWKAATVPELETMRESLRDLMVFIKDGGKKKHNIDIQDEIFESDFQPDATMIDIRTYREKVIDYLAEHLDSTAIRKIHNLEPITNNDLVELEHILWHELGTQQDYNETTDIGNLAAFVRSLIGVSQEAVNEKFGEYLNGNLLNAQQQEFVRTIINYARENGDVELADMVNTEPFKNYNLTEIFGLNFPALVTVINLLHTTIQVAA